MPHFFVILRVFVFSLWRTSFHQADNVNYGNRRKRGKSVGIFISGTVSFFQNSLRRRNINDFLHVQNPVENVDNLLASPGCRSFIFDDVCRDRAKIIEIRET